MNDAKIRLSNNTATAPIITRFNQGYAQLLPIRYNIRVNTVLVMSSYQSQEHT